jgi:hypothetical protein
MFPPARAATFQLLGRGNGVGTCALPLRRKPLPSIHCHLAHFPQRRPGRVLMAGATVPALVLVVAACGSTTTASPAAAGSASPGSASAYFTCLREHGVTGFGGGPGSSSTSAADSSTLNSARQACAPLRPSGGFGGFGGSGAFSAAFQKFESCLSAHGVTLPSPSAGGFRSLFSALQSGSQADQAAFSACKSDLPFNPGG